MSGCVISRSMMIQVQPDECRTHHSTWLIGGYCAVGLLALADALAAAVDMEEQAIVLLQDENTPGHRKNLADMRRAKLNAARAYRAARGGA